MFWINFDQKIVVDDYGDGGDQDNMMMNEYDDNPVQGKGKGYDINYDPKGKGKGYM